MRVEWNSSPSLLMRKNHRRKDQRKPDRPIPMLIHQQNKGNGNQWDNDVCVKENPKWNVSLFNVSTALRISSNVRQYSRMHGFIQEFFSFSFGMSSICNKIFLAFLFSPASSPSSSFRRMNTEVYRGSFPCTHPSKLFRWRHQRRVMSLDMIIIGIASLSFLVVVGKDRWCRWNIVVDDKFPLRRELILLASWHGMVVVARGGAHTGEIRSPSFMTVQLLPASMESFFWI